MPSEQTAAAFERTKDLTGANDVAAALLVLADGIAVGLDRIADRLKDFDHQICMGIRHGLMGNYVDATANVGSLSGISEAIEDLTSAVDHFTGVVEAK